jgi:lysophospholipase L1-like esterase
MRQPAPNLGEFHPNNERVKIRNKIVVDLAAKEGIPVDDLYRLVENHQEYWGNDGVHFNAKGQAVEAKQVAKAVLDSLTKSAAN